jgi:hypothetical protein
MIRYINQKLDYRYIYILGNTRYIFRYKIGITHTIETRKKSIDNSLKGTTYEILCVKVFFAMKVEQLLHALYTPLSARMYGSGKTEWFWMILPITPIILVLSIWIIELLVVPIFLMYLYYMFYI